MGAITHSRQFDNICRTCLEEKQRMKWLFDTDCSLGQALQLCEMLMACTTVDVKENDGLPAQICLSCINHIARSLSFKRLSETSDATLREVLRKSTLTDDEPMIEMKPSSDVALCSQGTVADIDTDLLDIMMKFEEEETRIGVGTESMDCEDKKLTMISAHEPKPQISVQPASNEDTKSDTKHDPLSNEAGPALNCCEECRACFTLEDDLKIHACAHHKSMQFVCKVCNKDCINAGILYSHQRVHRTKSHVCTDCGRGFKRAYDLKRHLKTHTGSNNSAFVCDSCGNRFVDWSALIAHARTHTNETNAIGSESEKVAILPPANHNGHGKRRGKRLRNEKEMESFTCTVCDEKCSTSTSLSVHMKQQHTVVRNLKARERTRTGAGTESTDCEGKMTMIDAYELTPQSVQPASNEDTTSDTKHDPLLIETGPSNYRCDECSACFTLKNDLKIHVYTHRKSTQYVCNVCNKDCVTARSLYGHAKVHRARTHVCSSCGRGFKRADDLKRHLKTHIRNSSSFVCYSCGEEFVDSPTLIAHARTHTDERSVEQPRRKKKAGPKRMCSYCGKVCGNLAAHERTHSGERPFRCNVCNKAFGTNTHLKIHLRSHSGEKPYVCKMCGKGFGSSPQLLVHVRTHTGERPYKCQLCPKAFVRLADLRLHTQVHTGERNHICEYCQRGFYRADLFKIHVATHTGIKPYKCHICDNSYAIEIRLKQHLKKH